MVKVQERKRLSSHPRKDELIKQTIQLLHQKCHFAQVAMVEELIRHFYKNVADLDMVGNDPETLLRKALSFWDFCQKRQVGIPKIRIFNPDADQHGWSSSHTIIEIINDDMPFLVDSIMAELGSRDVSVHIIIHPIFTVRRDSAGQIEDLSGNFASTLPDSYHESWMYIEIDAMTSQKLLHDLEKSLHKILMDVRTSTQDWRKMLAEVKHALDDLEHYKTRINQEILTESQDFLRWVEDNHFTFLGYRDYKLVYKGENVQFQVEKGQGLGLLRDDSIQVFEGIRELETLPADVLVFVDEPQQFILIAKSNKKSTVHRRAPVDCILVKHLNDQNQTIGLRVFIGLFTSTAYYSSPTLIPLVRLKVSNTIAQTGFKPNSHDGKALLHILETYPRDELFQTSEEDLARISVSILQLQERQRSAVFVRKDPFERFVSCLVFIPKDRYSLALRNKIGKLLEETFEGAVSGVYPQIAEDTVLARIHYIVKTQPGAVPDQELNHLQELITAVVRDWRDALRQSLIEQKGEERGLMLFRRYEDAFPTSYSENFNTLQIISDIDEMELLWEGAPIAINLYRPLESDVITVRLKLFHPQRQLVLSDVLPMLENMGARVIDEVPYEVKPRKMSDLWIHDFGLFVPEAVFEDFATFKKHFADCLLGIWNKQIENDPYNKLVLAANLNWRDVMIIRAYGKYLKQIQVQFSQEYMQEVLVHHADFVILLIKFFKTRFDPLWQAQTSEKKRRAEWDQLQDNFEQVLQAVVSLDEDRILRRFLNLIQATMRTNYFQDQDGQPKNHLVFKISSQIVDRLPLPVPYAEIFVYSPAMEAIHLRGGKVARGGIRWSDRKEDFRTEVLGLQKAQMVKNTVIVPVGSKGGFIVKQLPEDPALVMPEVVSCYRTFMSGLLDVTDNIIHGDVVQPKQTVCWDDDDPYLVVAADKGTATFSDIANEISKNYGFWLRDAFASGGSDGYDHKKIGITARGAWESVKRHFRELDMDVMTQEFTTVGIGDMSGDVFGNGMLQSKTMKLVAAFNHQHIFIDPTPDPHISYEERKRLFDLPRSSWKDYNLEKISEGGGVFDRKAKAIRLSDQMRALFDTKEDFLAPADMVQLILQLPVDLLWFGGIGTYVKAVEETQNDVGDRANDAVRVDAMQLHCRVIAEGANLGITQRGRIEFALQGGKINTDWIDNSGGVNCSDHEVNIKILLNDLVSKEELTLKKRNDLLVRMTDEVAALVLKDNYAQAQAISFIETQASEALDRQHRLIKYLEKIGRLSRKIEFLPDDEELEQRKQAHTSLTRPEIAVLLSYSKMHLYDVLLASDFPDDPFLVEDLIGYFPQPIIQNFAASVPNHPLRREIIVTVFVNGMVNRFGPTFFSEITHRTGFSFALVAKAITITRTVLGYDQLWKDIESLDNTVHPIVQYHAYADMARLADRITTWFLRHEFGEDKSDQDVDMKTTIDHYRKAIQAISSQIEQLLPPERLAKLRERQQGFMDQSIQEGLALRLATLEKLTAACDIVAIASKAKQDILRIASLYFAVGDIFHFDWLRSIAKTISLKGEWDKRAVSGIIEDLYQQQSQLVMTILKSVKAKDCDHNTIQQWIEAHQDKTDQAQALVDELKQIEKISLPMVMVATRHLASMI